MVEGEDISRFKPVVITHKITDVKIKWSLSTSATQERIT